VWGIAKGAALQISFVEESPFKDGPFDDGLDSSATVIGPLLARGRDVKELEYLSVGDERDEA
jgi:hypothetical protein